MKRILLLLFLVVFLISCSEDEPVVTGISLDKSELTLKIGESYQFKLSHMPLKANGIYLNIIQIVKVVKVMKLER